MSIFSKKKKTTTQAHNIIKELNISNYIKEAKKKSPNINEKKLENEYKQHLLILFVNANNNQNDIVAPTESADIIWKLHILDKENYEAFCKKLFGKTIYRNTDLDNKQKRKKAITNTKALQESIDKEDCFMECLFLAYAFGAFDDSESEDSDCEELDECWEDNESDYLEEEDEEEDRNDYESDNKNDSGYDSDNESSRSSYGDSDSSSDYSSSDDSSSSDCGGGCDD